ncbi:hypothetical protein BC793_1494 [Actinoplanes xinjiangensis]|uniref:Uncharacterized protein n=1 Tax=Actinoplanes xinjiangensis TaxID=512350 RepID=A0A316EG31_9ACTN|nr:hypothetical protein BC793_1494 [Actinoplanes xinjiangensis]
MIDFLHFWSGIGKNSCMGQGSLFSRVEISSMRDRTRSRNYSSAREEFRREHERHRAWGLQRRHAEKLRRLRQSESGPTVGGDQVPVAGTSGSGSRTLRAASTRATLAAPPPAHTAPQRTSSPRGAAPSLVATQPSPSSLASAPWVRGSPAARESYDVQIRDAQGGTRIRSTQTGDAQVRDAQGGTQIRNTPTCDVQVRDVQGGSQACDARSGDVQTRDAQGEAQVHDGQTSDAQVRDAQGGSQTCDARSGHVQTRDAQGDAHTCDAQVRDAEAGSTPEPPTSIPSARKLAVPCRWPRPTLPCVSPRAGLYFCRCHRRSRYPPFRARPPRPIAPQGGPGGVLVNLCGCRRAVVTVSLGGAGPVRVSDGHSAVIGEKSIIYRLKPFLLSAELEVSFHRERAPPDLVLGSTLRRAICTITRRLIGCAEQPRDETILHPVSSAGTLRFDASRRDT